MLYEIEALKMGVEVYAHHVLLKSVYRCHPHLLRPCHRRKPSSDETGRQWGDQVHPHRDEAEEIHRKGGEDPHEEVSDAENRHRLI